MSFLKEQSEMEIQKFKDTANIETNKFKNMVDAIGTNTLQAIATAGPEMQVCTDSIAVYLLIILIQFTV